MPAKGWVVMLYAYFDESERTDGTFAVAGVIVSSSIAPYYGGIRVVDNSTVSLIKTYLP